MKFILFLLLNLSIAAQAQETDTFDLHGPLIRVRDGSSLSGERFFVQDGWFEYELDVGTRDGSMLIPQTDLELLAGTVVHVVAKDPVRAGIGEDGTPHAIPLELKSADEDPFTVDKDHPAHVQSRGATLDLFLMYPGSQCLRLSAPRLRQLRLPSAKTMRLLANGIKIQQDNRRNQVPRQMLDLPVRPIENGTALQFSLVNRTGGHMFHLLVQTRTDVFGETPSIQNLLEGLGFLNGLELSLTPCQ